MAEMGADFGGRCFAWLLKDNWLGSPQLNCCGKGKQNIRWFEAEIKTRQPISAICEVRNPEK